MTLVNPLGPPVLGEEKQTQRGSAPLRTLYLRGQRLAAVVCNTDRQCYELSATSFELRIWDFEFRIWRHIHKALPLYASQAHRAAALFSRSMIATPMPFSSVFSTIISSTASSSSSRNTAKMCLAYSSSSCGMILTMALVLPLGLK